MVVPTSNRQVGQFIQNCIALMEDYREHVDPRFLGNLWLPSLWESLLLNRSWNSNQRFLQLVPSLLFLQRGGESQCWRINHHLNPTKMHGATYLVPVEIPDQKLGIKYHQGIEMAEWNRLNRHSSQRMIEWIDLLLMYVLHSKSISISYSNMELLRLYESCHDHSNKNHYAF
jgi:hypothetical protein